MAPDPERPELSLSADVLAPEGYGEIVGGGERLADGELLLKRIHEHELPEESFRWYLDLRTLRHRAPRRLRHGDRARRHLDLRPRAPARDDRVPAHAVPDLPVACHFDTTPGCVHFSGTPRRAFPCARTRCRARPFLSALRSRPSRVPRGRRAIPWPRVPREHLHDERPGSDFQSVRLDSSGNFVVVWESVRPGRIGLRHLRPALRQRRRPARPRVPGQHLHDELAKTLRPSPRTPPATSSSSGQTPQQDGVGRRRLRPALRQLRRPARRRVPRQHLHDERRKRPRVRGLRRRRQLRRRLAELRPGRPRLSASSASATPAPARRSAPSSGSTPTRRTTRAFPSVASDTAGNFVVVWQQRLPGRLGLRHLRPALRQLRRPARQRVPGQHLHDGHSDAAVRRLGRRRQLRRRLGRATGRTARADGIFGQRYASSGAPPRPRVPRQHLHDGHPVSSVRRLGRRRQLRRRLAAACGQDGSSLGVFGQRYASSGAPLGAEFQVNTYTTNIQVSPSVASDTAGNFVVVWESYHQDGSGYGRLRPALRVHCAPGGSRRHQDRRPDDSRRGPSGYVHDRRRERRTERGQRRDGHGYGAPGHPRGDAGRASAPAVRTCTASGTRQHQ